MKEALFNFVIAISEDGCDWLMCREEDLEANLRCVNQKDKYEIVARLFGVSWNTGMIVYNILQMHREK